MKKLTKIILVVLLCCVALGSLCACSSRLGEHASTYFSGIGKVFSDSAEYNKVMAELNNPQQNENALAMPTNFKVEDGIYSFDKVDGAGSYVISIYETSGTLTALASKTIEAGSESTYTGNVSDITPNLSYGEWFFRVIAKPTADSTLEESAAAMTTYIVKGAVTNGTVTTAYIWNACTGDLTLNLNGLDYSQTAYPTNINVTLTNQSTNKTYSVDTGKVTSGTVSVDAVLPKEDATYSIALDCTWDENYVTNPSWQTTVSQNITVSASESSLSDGMSYSSGIFVSFDFPLVYENFAIDQIPTDKTYAEVAYDDGVEFGKYGNDVSFKAFPLWTEKGYAAKEGAVKSYDVRIKGSGSITATPKNSPGSGSTTMIFGQLDFYEDGTFTLELEYQYISTDGMNDAVYYVPGTICEGIYVVNEDGTYTLSFDYANAYESDYEIVQELNGRASYYSEVDADWKNSGNNNGGGGDNNGGGDNGGGGGGWTISPASPMTFEAGAETISMDLGVASPFAGTLTTASEGSTYTYNTHLDDANAPFSTDSTLELKEDGTAVWSLPNAAGPLSATTLTGTWEEVDGNIVITWN